VCEASVDIGLIETHWDSLVHLTASVMSGHASAVAALARFGSAAQGDPIYDAGVQLGRLLRSAFLADYFVKDSFRNELRRVLNRGEAVNALKRAIYTGRISPAQAKRVDEMQAVADALSLLANIVMAWNTSQMQTVLDRWSNRRQVIPPELIGKIAPQDWKASTCEACFDFRLTDMPTKSCRRVQRARELAPVDETDYALTPQSADSNVNRKPNEINDLARVPHASARFAYRQLLH
jgi:hypothetical protein